MTPFPASPAERTRWIVQARDGVPRVPVEATRPAAWIIETERQADGTLAEGLTVFLVNRECPWHCAMCDLWRYTIERPVGPGDIPRQLDVAFAEASRPSLSWIKLYNAGSFFDSGAIPVSDHAEIAARCTPFKRVIVECHPALVGPGVVRFRDSLAPGTRLEVAMGLETVHPGALDRLNKRITTRSFRAAADFLHSHDCDLRTFLLVRPPFIPEADCPAWLERSIDFAFECEADPVVLIPTRTGNGAMERLLGMGEFSLPRLELLEEGIRYGLHQGRGRVFADLWDLERFVAPGDDLEGRRALLETVNRDQKLARGRESSEVFMPGGRLASGGDRTTPAEPERFSRAGGRISREAAKLRKSD